MWATPLQAKSKPPKRLEIQVRNLDAERDDVPVKSGLATNMDSLLRLFRSDFFDAFMAVTYLYRYKDTRGVHDYLCNELYVLSDADLEIFMPQLCNLLVHHVTNSPGLERFVMDKCASSMHFSVQVYWFLQAAVEDAIREKNKDTEERCRYLRTQCETAAVNGSQYALRTALSSSKFYSSGSLVDYNTPDPVLVVQENLDDDDEEMPPVLDSTELSTDMEALNISKDFGKQVDLDNKQADKDDAVAPSPCTITEEPLSEDQDIEKPENSQGNTHGSMRIEQVEGACDETANAGAAEESFPENVVSGAKENGTGSNGLKEKDESISDADGKSAEGEAVSNAELQNNAEEEVADGPEPTKEDEKEAEPVEMTTVESLPSTENREKNLKDDVGALESLDCDPMQLVRMKQERFDYFQDSLAIIKLLVSLSLSTREQAEPNRMSHLVTGLHRVNDMLCRRMCGDSAEPLVATSPAPKAEDVVALGRSGALRSIHLPLTRADSQVLRILRVLPEESVILTSRTRCPYLLYVEVLPCAMTCSDRLVFCEHMGVAHTPDPQQNRRLSTTREAAKPPKMRVWNSSSAQALPNSEDITTAPVSQSGIPKRSRRKLSEMTPHERQCANVRQTIYGDAYSDQPENFEIADREDLTMGTGNSELRSRQAALLAVFGELWSWKEERLLKKSPFSDSKAKLMSFIIKAGDDLRQEQLAIQLIKQFDWIFKEEDVDVFLRPFTVMSVSSEAGLVEVMQDTVSIHSLKGRTPNFKSLLDYFERAYGNIGSASFRAAQRRFIRSMAGYSLVCYLLQIKDRHNGNIMIDARGHIVHIDFGFMLTNSPGNVKFENAPFKLTEEYLQVICGMKNVTDINETSKTEGFRFFQELFVLGMLAARKHHDKILTLVRIMMDGTSMPCMTAGPAVLEGLESRFALGMPEKQCISHAISLIETSRLSIRSVGYDRFQAYSNGYR